jgi:protein-disulfide isomerase
MSLATELAATGVGCSRKTPRVPTRPASGPRKPGTTVDLHAEILDTEEGPIPIDDHDPQSGPPDATCVIVNFSDFQCPFCADIAAVLSRIRRESPKQVRLVFKHLPLPMHREAREAAIASQVVFLEAGTDAFWRFHDRAFAHPHDLETSVLTNWAHDEGVKAEQIAARAKDAEARLVADMALADKLGIHGTPHLYINARAIAGAFPYEQIRAWVDEEI